jgi:hypothetical protein
VLLFSQFLNGTSNVQIVNSNCIGREGSYEIPQKIESGFVFGSHRTQFPQQFATRPNLATFLARTAGQVSSQRTGGVAAQDDADTNSVISLREPPTVVYNASLALFAPGPKYCIRLHQARPEAPVHTLTLRTVGRMA